MIPDSAVVFSGSSGEIGSHRPPTSRTVHSLLESPLADKIAELARLQPTPHTFVHLAAMVSIKECADNPELCQQLNVEGSLQWFKASIATGIKRFVFVSSAHVYDTLNATGALTTEAPVGPITEYGRSKLQAEQQLTELATTSSIELTIARVFSVLANPGPPWSLHAGLHRRARNKDFSPIPGLHNIRDFLTSEEVCQRLLTIAKASRPLPPIVNVCSGKGVAITDLAERVFQQYGLSAATIKEAPGPAGARSIIGVPTEIGT